MSEHAARSESSGCSESQGAWLILDFVTLLLLIWLAPGWILKKAPHLGIFNMLGTSTNCNGARGKRPFLAHRAQRKSHGWIARRARLQSHFFVARCKIAKLDDTMRCGRSCKLPSRIARSVQLRLVEPLQWNLLPSRSSTRQCHSSKTGPRGSCATLTKIGLV